MAKTTLQISIPEPCHEDWSKMTPTQCGAFCKACQKEVVDFSQMSEAEIVGIISKASGKVCGRITADKLNKELVKYEPDHAWYSWKKWAVAAGVLLGVSQAKANVLEGDTIVKPKTDTTLAAPSVISPGSHQPTGEYEIMGGVTMPATAFKIESLSEDSVVILSGQITDMFNEPLESASVILRAQYGEGTVTDKNGKYELIIPAHLHNMMLSLSVHYIGYADTSFSFIANKSKVQDVRLKPDRRTIEELYMVGMMVRSTPASRIRSFFRRIGYAFKRHKD